MNFNIKRDSYHEIKHLQTLRRKIKAENLNTSPNKVFSLKEKIEHILFRLDKKV